MFPTSRLVISGVMVLCLLMLLACSPVENRTVKPLATPEITHGHFVAADGALLPLRSWLPEKGRIKAVIVALHGFNDYGNFFTNAGKYLSRQGVASYAYDQRGFGGAPGHGLWAGVEAYTGDISAFVTEIHKIHPGVPVYLLGESMGGAVSIVAMTGSKPPQVDGVILVAPAVWGRQTMPWYQKWLLAVSSHTVPWMKLTGKSLRIKASDNMEMLLALGRDALVIKATRIDSIYGLTNLMDQALLRAKDLQIPTLVQYGANDQVIPKISIFMMLEKMPVTTRKAFYPQGYHMLLRDLQGEKPLADIAAWIAGHDNPLPHGVASMK